MHVASLIASALSDKDKRSLPCDPVEAVCAITGLQGLCVPRKKAIGANFTALDAFAGQNSDFVSVDVWWSLKYKWQRMSSWWTDGDEMYLLRRTDVRPLVLGGVPTRQPWAGYVTTSYKKHGFLIARVNTGTRALWAFDDVLIDCSDRERVNAWYNHLNGFLRAGIGRPALLTPDTVSPYLIAKVGLAVYMDCMKWARGKMHSPLYQFLVYLLPSQEELKAEKKGDAEE